jgi:hypothetical protein
MLYAGSLWLSNSAYLYLSVSFIQMTKSLMPGLVYACGCMVGTEAPTLSAALNMALIAVGVLVCALGEVNLVLAGLLQQLVALGFEVSSRTGHEPQTPDTRRQQQNICAYLVYAVDAPQCTAVRS